MRGIVWLDSAVNDVVRLKGFIAKDNPNAAKQAADAIKENVQRLIELPSLGKPVEDLPQYHDLLIRFGVVGYVLRYRVHLDMIYVVHIRHYRENDFKR
jgi:plasmid stabilization system protein ParE